MTATQLSIYDLPLKPVAGPDRTPALIAREVDQIMRRTKETVTLASIAIGYRLVEAKRLEGHGGWLPWLAARGINDRTARRAMELASHHEHLSEEQPDQLPSFVTKSLRQALAIVHEDRVASGKARRPRQPTPPAGAPVSDAELTRWAQQVPGAAPALALGVEPISMADLGPAARRQVREAVAEPVTVDGDGEAMAAAGIQKPLLPQDRLRAAAKAALEAGGDVAAFMDRVGADFEAALLLFSTDEILARAKRYLAQVRREVSAATPGSARSESPAMVTPARVHVRERDRHRPGHAKPVSLEVAMLIGSFHARSVAKLKGDMGQVAEPKAQRGSRKRKQPVPAPEASPGLAASPGAPFTDLVLDNIEAAMAKLAAPPVAQPEPVPAPRARKPAVDPAKADTEALGAAIQASLEGGETIATLVEKAQQKAKGARITPAVVEDLIQGRIVNYHARNALWDVLGGRSVA